MIDLDGLERALIAHPGMGQWRKDCLALIAELRAARRVVEAAIAIDNDERRFCGWTTIEDHCGEDCTCGANRFFDLLVEQWPAPSALGATTDGGDSE